MAKKPTTTRCVTWLKALADVNRLKIVQQLEGGPKNVTSLADSLGMGMATASHHLQVLLHAGLVEISKEGRFSFYRLNSEFVRNGGSKRGVTLDFECCLFHLSK